MCPISQITDLPVTLLPRQNGDTNKMVISVINMTGYLCLYTSNATDCSRLSKSNHNRKNTTGLH